MINGGLTTAVQASGIPVIGTGAPVRSELPSQSADSIPFNRPCYLGTELAYIDDALRRGHISGDGFYTRRCERLLADSVGAQRAMLTSSCTHALEMAALLLNLGPGDEVIMPSYTFVSTANAVALRGASPVFVDVHHDTLNLNETLVAEAITHRTKAIICVHYAGVACNMDALVALADEHRIHLIEDNAHGLFGTYKGRPLGSFGSLAAVSFHETKNFTCGEGGALFINVDNFVDAAEVIRDKGTNRRRFFRGDVDKYTWVGLGSSYCPSELQAAFLFAQLQEKDQIQARREEIWRRYQMELADWATENRVVMPTIPTDCDSTYHLFHLLLPTSYARDRFIRCLSECGIKSVFHYQPLHLSQMGREIGGKPMGCPVTERAGDCLARLPIFHDLSPDGQRRVINAIRVCRPSAR